MDSDYYEILGVSKTATAAEIRATYFALAQRFHPDLHPDEQVEREFKRVQTAYEVLSDPDLRATYDHSPERLHKREVVQTPTRAAADENVVHVRSFRTQVLSQIDRRPYLALTSILLAIAACVAFLAIAIQHEVRQREANAARVTALNQQDDDLRESSNSDNPNPYPPGGNPVQPDEIPSVEEDKGTLREPERAAELTETPAATFADGLHPGTEPDIFSPNVVHRSPRVPLDALPTLEPLPPLDPLDSVETDLIGPPLHADHDKSFIVDSSSWTNPADPFDWSTDALPKQHFDGDFAPPDLPIGPLGDSFVDLPLPAPPQPMVKPAVLRLGPEPSLPAPRPAEKPLPHYLREGTSLHAEFAPHSQRRTGHGPVQRTIQDIVQAATSYTDKAYRSYTDPLIDDYGEAIPMYGVQSVSPPTGYDANYPSGFDGHGTQSVGFRSTTSSDLRYRAGDTSLRRGLPQRLNPIYRSRPTGITSGGSQPYVPPYGR